MNRRIVLGSAALSLLTLSGCAGNATTESTGEYIDDSVITTKVKTAIADDLGLGSATEVGVETFKGVVQLSGFVDSAHARDSAERVAWNIDGVTDVENHITLK